MHAQNGIWHNNQQHFDELVAQRSSVALFTIDKRNKVAIPDLKDFELLSINDQTLHDLYRLHPQSLALNIPYKNESLQLLLVENNIYSAGTSKDRIRGRHYYGVLKTDHRAVVSLSVFEDHVVALISTPKRQLTLTRKGKSTHYVIYDSDHLPEMKPFSCEELDFRGAENTVLDQEVQRNGANNCVNVFVEVQKQLWDIKGNQTTAYVESIFNQVSTLYANEDIDLNMNALEIWTQDDPYYDWNESCVDDNTGANCPNVSNQTRVSQYIDIKNGVYDGDIAVLLGEGNGGGIAARGSLCNKKFSVSFCSIDDDYMDVADVPVFSQVILTVAHEIGHILGSPHTHACAWNGDNTPIDWCAPTVNAIYNECDPTPQNIPTAPENGGTVMSYCHVGSTGNNPINPGINFAEGFGQQPGDLIRSRVANANCLSACCADEGQSCDDGDACTVNDIIDGDCNCTGTAIQLPTLQTIKMEQGILSYNSNNTEWHTIALENEYDNMVVVATVALTSGSQGPVVPRVKDAELGTPKIKLQSANENAVSGVYTIHYMVVEAGIYTQQTHGFNMEAYLVNSTGTGNKLNGWDVFEERCFQNNYTNPVVLGQVMTYNDAKWSVFWASEHNDRIDRPSSSSFAAGKMVGEDTDVVRADESIGIVVVEQGIHTAGNLIFKAGITGDVVEGVDNSVNGYSINTGLENVGNVVLSATGMDGGDGGWPILFTSNPINGNNFVAAIDEDQLDPAINQRIERGHINEEVAYLAFQAVIVMEEGTTTVNGDAWTTVNLDNNYNAMVVVATTEIASKDNEPVVTRIKNTTGSSFQVRVQNPGGTATGAHTVRYLVVEEGSYTQADHGITMEAQRVSSTKTADNNNWNTSRETRQYNNTYTSPVVLGQVMSFNDSRWSVFWASESGSYLNPPSSTSFAAGKMVGEDPDITRLDETLGIIIFEAGSYTIGDLTFETGISNDIVKGVQTNASGAVINTGIGSLNNVIVSNAGMDGADGGWPILFTQNPISGAGFTVAIDEDQLFLDSGEVSERNHTDEQVAYIAFQGAQSFDEDAELRSNANTTMDSNPVKMQEEKTVRVYPNPVTDLLYIEASPALVTDEKATLILMTITGQPLRQWQQAIQSNMQVDVSELPSNQIYLLYIRGHEGNMFVNKLVK